MKAFYRAGVRTTCFISPIFPGITDVKAIIGRVKGQCNLIWLENLNLRGSCKTVILGYIQEKYPALLPLYREIYQKGSRSYWERLDERLRAYAAETGLAYVTNDDSMKRPFDAPPASLTDWEHGPVSPRGGRAGGLPGRA